MVTQLTLVHLDPRLLLDPDLEAEAVAGVTLRRLTGAGTVPFGTRRRRARNGPTCAHGWQATVTHFRKSEALVTYGNVWTAVTTL